MNIDKKMQDAFNKQIAAELWSSNLYLSMALYFRKEGWNGFAKWMMKQAEEEKEHGMDMADYIIKRGGEAIIGEVKAVKTTWTSPKEVFEDTLKHEQAVTEMVNKLADVADELKDRASQNFIAKYIDEQVEEEHNCNRIITLFDQMPQHTVAQIDRKLGERV